MKNFLQMKYLTHVLVIFKRFDIVDVL